MFEREVYGGCDEAGGEDEAGNLHCECGLRPWVGVHSEATDVAEGFHEGACGEGEGVGPEMVDVCEDKVGEDGEEEDGEEEDVCSEVGGVAVGCAGDGT